MIGSDHRQERDRGIHSATASITLSQFVEIFVFLLTSTESEANPNNYCHCQYQRKKSIFAVQDEGSSDIVQSEALLPTVCACAVQRVWPENPGARSLCPKFRNGIC